MNEYYLFLCRELLRYLSTDGKHRYQSKDNALLQLWENRKGIYLSFEEQMIPLSEGERLQEIICRVKSRIENIIELKSNREYLIAASWLVALATHLDLVEFQKRSDYYVVSKGNDFIFEKELLPSNLIPSGSRRILGGKNNAHNYEINTRVLDILSGVQYKVAKDRPIHEVDLSDKGLSKADREICEANLREENRLRQEFDLEKVYFTYAYDKRGRIYTKESIISPQSYEENKAILSFAKEKTLDEKGWYWFKIAIANAFGLDKATWSERISWFEANEKDILAGNLNDKASEKHLFKQAIDAYNEALLTGKTGYIVRLDATCSGPQLMSVIMRDVELMKKLNVIGDSERKDFYTIVTDEMNSLGCDRTFNRQDVKDATMIHFYNGETKIKDVFEDDVSYFYQAIKNIASSAEELKEAINSCWDNKKDLYIWTLPDGHTAYCPITWLKEHKIEIEDFMYEGNKISTKIIVPEIGPNKNKNRCLSPHIIHSIDATILRYIVSNLDDQGIECSPIHDSFGVHPNDCDVLRTSYRGMLARLYRENWIDDILSEIVGETVEVERPKTDPEIEKAIRSNVNGYYIC